MIHDVPDECDDGTRALEKPAEDHLTTVDAGTTSLPLPGSESDPGLDPGTVGEFEIFGPPRVGKLFFRNKFIFERQIGEGGMGTVWLARNLKLDTLRALKLIISGIADEPQMRARFLREARAMAKLSHPNAVAVHDVNVGRDSAFIEMDYIRGQSLNRLLTPGVPMPLDWTARIVEQLCDVLQEAHDQKIVHRDLKPSNLMLVADRPPGKEQLKVLDFGIAKILESDTEDEASDVLTGTGCFLGSAPWSSPEQISGGVVDARSDLYSVGILLYEFLTGSRPFNGSFVQQAYEHVNKDAPRFAIVNPGIAVPPAVEELVLRCLSKDPDARPQNARDLAAEFLWAISDGFGTTSYPGPSVLPAPGDSARTVAIFGDSEAPTPLRVSPSARAETGDPGSGPATEPQSLQTTPLGLDVSWPDTEQAFYTRDSDPSKDRGDGSMVATIPTEVDTGTGTEDEDEFETGTGTGTEEATRKRPRRRRWLTLATLTAFLFVAGLFVWSAWTSTLRVPEGYRAEGLTPGTRLPAALVRTRDGTRFLHIPGGEFLMGNDGFDRTATASLADEDQPAHPVRLSDYYLQETEVTNGEMAAYFREMKLDKSQRPRRFQEAWDQIDENGLDPAKYPAVGVSHALAEGYARWVGGELPTEAQWEYAARSRGQPRRFIWPDDDEWPNSRNCNIESRGNDTSSPTRVVGFFPKDRTEQGISDLTGNVREWCRNRWSKYQPSEVALIDPEGPDPSHAGPLDFVVRGGSFASWKDLFRTTRPRRIDRDLDDLTARQLEEDRTAEDVGFRVVIEWPPKRGR